MKWDKKEIDSEKVRELAARYNIDLLPASILLRRGVVTPGDICFFLEDDVRYLHNPFLFDEMEETVDRILAAKEEGEKVLVFGDRDADGITSIVLLVQGLRELGMDVEYALPLGDDPYGLTIQAVETFAGKEGTLIITVDCGISCVAEIERANQLGIDTIVIDHHNPPDVLPQALSIINPKMPDSGYPFRDLAGCGVVSKVLWALRFAETGLYNQSFCLVNVRPGNEMLIIEAVRIVNLVEIDRLVENIVPEIVDGSSTKFVRFVEGQQILVYGAEAQTRMLRRIFGGHAEIHLQDLAPEIWKSFPALEGKSLLRMKDLSRMARYLEKAPAEIDIFTNIFMSYMQKREQRLVQRTLKDLDLVAVGTLADLMPLKDENRVLVRKGLAMMSSTDRGGLRALIMRQNLLGKKLATTDVAWQISPVVNASGRMGEPDKAVELFLSDSPDEQEQLADYLCGLNKERKKLGDDIWTRILPQAQKSFELLDSRLVMVSDETIHRGITGIIAARLVNYFRVPAAVIAHLDKSVVGSLRSTRGFDVKLLLEHCSDLFQDYGGHDFAAGFNMVKNNFQAFEERVKQFIGRIELGEDGDESITINAEIPLSYLSPDIVKIVESFEPFGEENPHLVFLTKGMKISNIELIGKREQNHVRLLFDSGKFKFPAVFWNSAERVGRDFSANDSVNVVYQVKKNYFQNTETIQLNVLDIQ